MKKLIALTTICAAMLCMGTSITASVGASAEEGITIPESFSVEFTVDSVTDYAVSDRQIAFASGNCVYLYTIDKSESYGYDYRCGEITTYVHSSNVLIIEYIDGVLAFGDSSSSYKLVNGEAVSAEVKFTDFVEGEVQQETDAEKGIFYYSVYPSTHILYVINIPNNEDYGSLNDAVYSKLKKIGDCFYVLKDNTLCALSLGVLSEMSFSYEDFDSIDPVATGSTAQALNKGGGVQLASIDSEAYLIRVDEDEFNNDYFSFLGVTYADDNARALILYMPNGGNAALIAIGAKTYLTLKSNLTILDYSITPISTGIQSYYMLDGAAIYSMPFENENTKIAEIDKDAVVTALGYLTDDALSTEFYKIAYNSDSGTVEGYVISGLLTPYTFSGDDSEENVIKNDTSYDNNVKTVVLVMIIVLLVLIAAGYITFVATPNKRRNRNKK